MLGGKAFKIQSNKQEPPKPLGLSSNLGSGTLGGLPSLNNPASLYGVNNPNAIRKSVTKNEDSSSFKDPMHEEIEDEGSIKDGSFYDKTIRTGDQMPSESVDELETPIDQFNTKNQ